MSINQLTSSNREHTGPLLFSNQGTLTTGFSTDACFNWLHNMNVNLRKNVRGEVNHEYNRKLQEQGLAAHCIPGGEDFERLGMDKATPIVRPDLYFQACQKVMGSPTDNPFSRLTLSTANFFDLLHQENVECNANVRGLVNHEYNQLLFKAGICGGRIPGDNPEQLGMDKRTPLRADLYLKAYEAVIVNFKASSLYFHCGPLQHSDLFQNTAQFVSYATIFRCAQVCKLWNEFSKHPDIWIHAFKAEGIPFVQRPEGKENNYKEEFRLLGQMRCLSTRKIGQLLGRIPGELPKISRECFEKLSGSTRDFFDLEEDPEKKKFMREAFEIVMIPSILERESCWETFRFVLNKDNNLEEALKESDCKGQTLRIPNKPENLKILCEHPLAGKENKKVFGGFFEYNSPKQWNTFPKEVSLVLMKTCIADGSRNKRYSAQENFVEEQGFQVASLQAKTFFDVICIKSGICPELNGSGGNYTRTSDSFIGIADYVNQMCIGEHFGGNKTISIFPASTGCSSDNTGVIPCISAEVPQLPTKSALENSFSLLECFGITTKAMCSEKLGCAPTYLQDIGIQTVADLEVLGIGVSPLPLMLIPSTTLQDSDDYNAPQREALENKRAVIACLATLTDEIAKRIKCSTVPFISSPSWDTLYEKILAAHEELQDKCKTPKGLLNTFAADSQAQILDQINALIDEFNVLDCEYQTLKLHAYISQWGILGAWNHLRQQGIHCLTDFMNQHPVSQDSLFKMGK